MKIAKTAVVVGALLGTMSFAYADNVVTTGFNGGVPAGWLIRNNSLPVGTTSWFNGDTGIFPSNDGPAESYLAANFNNALDNGGPNTISDWLITPTLTYTNGSTISFAARTADAGFLDSLQVRLSSNAGSINVGATATSVGDFTNLLLTATPNAVDGWTTYTATVSGLAGLTDGRVAFRYFVADYNTADYIGLDSVTISAAPEPGTPAILGLGVAALALTLRRSAAKRKESLARA